MDGKKIMDGMTWIYEIQRTQRGHKVIIEIALLYCDDDNDDDDDDYDCNVLWCTERQLFQYN